MATVAIRTAAKTKMFASTAAPATFDTTGYTALTWTAVNGFENIPQFGGVRDTVTFDDMPTGTRIKARGVEDLGELELDFADIPTDAGQIILRDAYLAASGTAAELISIKVEEDSGLISYMQVMVSSWPKDMSGGNNSVVRRKCKLLPQQGTLVE